MGDPGELRAEGTTDRGAHSSERGPLSGAGRQRGGEQVACQREVPDQEATPDLARLRLEAAQQVRCGHRGHHAQQEPRGTTHDRQGHQARTDGHPPAYVGVSEVGDLP